GDENLAPDPRAARRGKLAGIGVNLGADDAVGRFEGVDRAVFEMLMRALHELGPDRQRAARTFQLEVTVVVEAYPHPATQLGCEAGEPCIPRGAGLARRRKSEPPGSRAGAGTRAQHFFKHVLDQVGDSRIDGRTALGLRFKNRSTLLIADALDEAGFDQLA